MKIFGRLKLKGLILIMIFVVALLVVLGKRYLKNEPLNYVTNDFGFMELPETLDIRYKIISKIYFPQAIEDRGSTDVSIASQTSLNHLHNLINLVETWDGHISVGVFSLGIELEEALGIIKNLVLCHSKIANQVTFSLLVPLSHPPEETRFQFSITNNDKCSKQPMRMKDEQINYNNQVPYPVNALRNVALSNVHTSHVFVIDIDMIPSSNLRHHLLNTILQKYEQNELTAFVVPAFEVDSQTVKPDDKKQLLRHWKEGSVRPFYADVCWKCQKYTQYEYWQNEEEKSEELYKVDWVDPWEPFYVARRQIICYDERFEQYGFNRISQLCDIHLQGVTFYVLKRTFLLHVGFKKQNAFHAHKNEENMQNRLLYRNFKKEKTKAAKDGRTC